MTWMLQLLFAPPHQASLAYGVGLYGQTFLLYPDVLGLIDKLQSPLELVV